jgi:hypothetical protein
MSRAVPNPAWCVAILVVYVVGGLCGEGGAEASWVKGWCAAVLLAWSG